VRERWVSPKPSVCMVEAFPLPSTMSMSLERYCTMPITAHSRVKLYMGMNMCMSMVISVGAIM